MASKKSPGRAKSARPGSSKAPGVDRYGFRHTVREVASQVSLVPRTLGPPVQVRLTQAEKDALTAAARSYGNGQLSFFIRDLAVEAAKNMHDEARDMVEADKTVEWVISRAAEECGMLPGEFLRQLALEALGFNRFTYYAEQAREILKREGAGS